VIDTLRKQIQERLDQLLAEAEKLRKALSALGPRGQQAPARTATPRARRARARTPAPSATRARRRTPPGATKARVLEALLDGKAMTAGEVAAATGLGRGTVSTTLTKLAKSGEVRKAERGYALPRSRSARAGAAGVAEPGPPSA
jgi:DNA-binding transcriptional ArsR family regulator